MKTKRNKRKIKTDLQEGFRLWNYYTQTIK